MSVILFEMWPDRPHDLFWPMELEKFPFGWKQKRTNGEFSKMGVIISVLLAHDQRGWIGKKLRDGGVLFWMSRGTNLSSPNPKITMAFTKTVHSSVQSIKK